MLRALVLPVLVAVPALAQAPPSLAAAPAPKLKPGEALLVQDANGKLQAWGDAKTPHPLGQMAKFVWLRMDAADWANFDVYWDCRNPACQPPKGHGRVDLKKAFREDCDDAFLYWANWERQEWVEQEGEDVARLQLMGVFGPFLGDRFPKEGPLPGFTPEWMGRGDLLQASPEQFMAWLGAPENGDVMRMSREYLKGFFTVAMDLKKWWFKPGVCSQGTWVLAGDGQSAALLFLAMPQTPKEAVARMQDMLGLNKKK